MAPHKANAITITDQALWASRVREEVDVVTPGLRKNPSLLKKPDGVGFTPPNPGQVCVSASGRSG